MAQVDNPFVPGVAPTTPATSGQTTPAFAAPEPSIPAPEPSPAPAPIKAPQVAVQKTDLEKNAESLMASIRTQFPNSTSNEIADAARAVMFPPVKPGSSGKSYEQIVQDAENHRKQVAIGQFQEDTIGMPKAPSRAAAISKFAGDTLSAAQPKLAGQGPIPGIPLGATGALPGEAPTTDVYVPFTNRKMTLPTTPGSRVAKNLANMPEEAVNVVRDLYGIISGLVTGKGAQLPSDAMVPFNPQTGTGRRVPGLAEAYASTYQAGVTSGLSETSAKWVGVFPFSAPFPARRPRRSCRWM